jgi:superfamily II DNA or RNA helicase
MKGIKLKDDGLGYDSNKKLYFVVCYAWKYNTKDNNGKYLTLKSGITKYDVYTAMKQSAPKRGKMYETTALWGFKKDRMYLPSSVSNRDDAAKIVSKMDIIFKTTMEERGWDLRSIKSTDDVGTEFYCGAKNTILKDIQDEWYDALDNALKLFNKKKDKSKDKDLMSPRGTSQIEHVDVITKFLSRYNIGQTISPCGTGKTMMMFMDLFLVKYFKNKLINVVFGPKITAIQQVALNHAKIAAGTKYDGLRKIVIVCSDLRKNNEFIEYGIENISASDKRLQTILEDTFRDNIKVTFYVNMASAATFWKVYKKIKSKFNYKECSGNLWDEVHRYTGSKSKDNTAPVVKSDTDCAIGYTATPKYRGNNKDKTYIFQDDETIFGKVAQLVLPHQAIDDKQNSGVVFHLVEVWGDGEFAKEVNGNKEIEVLFKKKGKVETTKGFLLRAIPAIKKATQYTTHIYVPTSYRKNVSNLMRLVQEAQNNGYIDKDFELVRGLKEDGKKAFEEFSKMKKAIIFATRWSIESLDYPIIKGIVPTNNFESKIDADQTIGRGQRPFNDEVLHVFLPIDPSDKSNTLLEVAHHKIMNETTTVSETKETNLVGVDDLKGSSMKGKIKVEAHRDPSTPATYRVFIDDVLDTIQTSKFGKVLRNWRVATYSDEEIIDDAKKYDTPAKWRTYSESMYFHAYYRKEKDDLWNRATAHMEHRAARSISQFEQILKDADPFVGKVWALKNFSSKYPKHINWLKSNPKSKQPIKHNGKVVNMSMLPFAGGKMGHLTKEYIEIQMEGCECMTDLARKLGYSNQVTCRNKCDTLGIDYSTLEKTASERGKMANQRAEKKTDKLTHQTQSIRSIKKQLLEMELSDRTAVKEVVVSRTYNILRDEGWIDKNFPRIISNQFLKAAKKK